MKRLFFFILFFISFHVFLNAQKKITFHEQIIFSDYLVKAQLWDDVKTLLKINLADTSLSKVQKDSLHYIAGQVFYKTENFDSAYYYFNLIDNSSINYNNALLYASVSLAEAHRYDECMGLLSSITLSENISSEFINLERSGAMLLSRDTSGFSSVSENFTYNDKNLLQQEKNLIQLSNDFKNRKKKSGLLAGCMSAVIPGLGKIYTGKPYQGFSSMIPVTLLGIQAYEAYRKTDIKSARFIFSAGLFSIFYIGNIWGSVLSVSVKRTEFNNEIDNQILLNMRIPLQRISGKN